jgi:hypothetical protein
MSDYIYPAPGTTREVQVTLRSTAAAGNLIVPALQDVTINAARDVFTWSQLDSTAKKQVATTSTNSVDATIVVDKTTFFGSNVTASTANTAPENGVFGLSRNAVLCEFEVFLGAEAGNVSSNVTITGNGYVTGLAPTTSADSPVWTSPITITVDGEYAIIEDTAPPAS